MADSLVSIDKKRIFRNTFESEQSIRSNNIIPTNVTFSNGVATLASNGQLKLYKYFPSDTYSVRIRFKTASFSAYKYLFDNTTNDKVIYLDITTGTLQVSTGTRYVNGTVGSTITLNIWNDVIVTGFAFKSSASYSTIGNFSTTGLNGDIDLFEIYKGTLTAQEVQNLYNNSRYSAVQDHGEQLGAELVDQANWYKVSYWDTNIAGASQVGVTLSFPGSAGHLKTTSGFWTADRVYKVTISITRTSGTLYPPYYTTLSSVLSSSGTYSYYITPTGGTIMDIYSESFVGTITSLSIKQLIVYPVKEILNVSAQDGTIRNKYSGDLYNGTPIPSVIPTAVEVVKENDVYAMKFNGTSSKIDCGSYDGLVGDKTFITWLRVPENVINNYPLIIATNKMYHRFEGTTKVSLSRACSYFPMSDPGTTPRYSIKQIIVTSNSVGTTNIYLDGILSGSANQTGDIPISGTNIYISSNGTGNWFYKGLIYSVRILDGLLTANEISELYTSEKSKYGL